MNLKTLKDFEHSEEKWMGYDFVLLHVLREEAIKWIKEISKNGFDTRPKIFNMPIELDSSLPEHTIKLTTKEVTTFMIKKETDLVVQWIKQFFSITEEDLDAFDMKKEEGKEE